MQLRQPTSERTRKIAIRDSRLAMSQKRQCAMNGVTPARFCSHATGTHRLGGRLFIRCFDPTPALPFAIFGVGFEGKKFKKCLILLATPAGFEPATLSLEG
jgi:hypothetical protein